jgi:hypothetical protein
MLRDLAVKIAGEYAHKSTGKEILWRGLPITFVELILRRLVDSQDPRAWMQFLEIAFGKVPNNIDITSGGDKIIFEVVRDDVDGVRKVNEPKDANI